ncbi:MAG: uracil-DNA glycosylase [Methylococcales bacterium]|nr:uracil-DNA glycosylase [Methylococcales bacterium]
MNQTIRLQYLQAMGIDVWVTRHRPVAAAFNPAENSLSATDNPGEPSGDNCVWQDLRHEVAACRACSLCETRTQTVFGVGNQHADWMLIGEAPGQDEDLQGEPFVGKAGQLLNEMLRAIGMKREEVYIANMLKCRPPHNRDPQAGEVAACHAFLQKQIGLLQPKLILAVGRIAAQNLLNTQLSLTKLRGARHQFDNIPLVVVHHPAYLLRSPLEKAKAWEDLQFAVSVYKTL